MRLDYTGSALGHDIAGRFPRRRRARQGQSDARRARAALRRSTADVEALNLAVIDPDFPQTALRAHLEARGDEKAASGKLALENPEAGPLDRERLPLARAEAAFSTDFSSAFPAAT